MEKWKSALISSVSETLKIENNEPFSENTYLASEFFLFLCFKLENGRKIFEIGVKKSFILCFTRIFLFCMIRQAQYSLELLSVCFWIWWQVTWRLTTFTVRAYAHCSFFLASSFVKPAEFPHIIFLGWLSSEVLCLGLTSGKDPPNYDIQGIGFLILNLRSLIFIN